MGTLIVNPNPVFDRTIRLVELIPGAVMRTLEVELTAGGKGINVARALRALGTPASLLVPVGADDQQRYCDLLTAEGANFTAVPVPGPVRTASIYLEERVDRVTVVNDAGHPMDHAAWARVLDAVAEQLRADDLVLCMGSFPPDFPAQGLIALIDTVHRAQARILIDTVPNLLAAALPHHPDLVTPNLDEALAALDARQAHLIDADERSASEVQQQAMQVAGELCARGAQRAFVTAGSAGVALAHGEQCQWFASYPVTPVSTVGAGDSFVAGVASALHAQAMDGVAWAARDWATATLTGIATAATSCEQVRAGGIDAERVRAIRTALLARPDSVAS
ncbi:MAG: 1-phosphofructokinase family hexose kinase [Actinomycetales bacterium]